MESIRIFKQDMSNILGLHTIRNDSLPVKIGKIVGAFFVGIGVGAKEWVCSPVRTCGPIAFVPTAVTIPVGFVVGAIGGVALAIKKSLPKSVGLTRQQRYPKMHMEYFKKTNSNIG